ncbi:(2,3-dihydroxybenzoyl)adenylate synthase [Demetria terragena]|uniref:(2,3-dihydroxybenzoyl)adenylate synthase n=1 Tax=Demetria terragena TaxID=63959 RepID=UPI00037CA469|nr:AMP-binding protein [Demetria terragena]
MPRTVTHAVRSTDTTVEPLHLEGVVPYPADLAQEYRRHGWWQDQTFSEMLFDTIQRTPDRTALIAGESALTYAELGERVLRIAAGFQAMGITRGDRVVVQLPNLREYIPLLFGLYEIGAIPVLALAAHQRHEISHFVELAGACAYLTVESYDGVDLGSLAKELTESVDSLDHAVVLTADGQGQALRDLLAHEPLTHERRSLPEDVAFLQLSGGTTGTSKLIPHTHEAYLGSMRGAVRVGGTTEASVQLVVLPMPHALAMRSPGFLGALSVGATVVLAPDASPDSAFPLVEEHRVTELALVPPLALAWLNSSLRTGYDLSSMQILRVGGAAFGPGPAARVRPELGATLQQSYGMAEGLHTFTALDEDDAIITTRQGRPPSAADEIRIVDEHECPVPAGQPGQLLTRGPYTVRGYYRAPQHNAQAFTADGFYRVGDLVTQDDNGYLSVVGRVKDQINRGGEKVAPLEVENLLVDHPDVHDASVIGVPDERLGEHVKAFLVPRRGVEPSTLTVAVMRAYLRERGLAPYKLPDQVEVVTHFPRTVAGKVSKRDQRTQKA